MHRFVSTASSCLLLVFVALRPLITESYDTSSPGINQALSQLADPSPLTTLVFDALIVLAALGWAVCHAIRRDHPYRPSGLGWGLCILVTAAVISCAVAGHKRLAINGSIDWLCYPVAAIALAQLMRSAWHRQILLAVVLASAWAQSVQCYDQYFVGFEDTWNAYQEMRGEFWARQGVDLDSSTVRLFEHRIKAGEASGFLPHSGIAGSYLVMCALASLGVAIDLVRRACHRAGLLIAAGAVLGTVLIAGAVLLTGSTGAIVSAIVGLTLWGVLVLARRWVDANRAKALWLGGSFALGVCLVVVARGLYHGSLPRGSMGFRWRYWDSSAQMIADHGLTGVGRENYGRHYLRYKGMDSPEEIATPHNFLVQATSEWGVLGLVGISMMLVGGLVAVAGPARGAPSTCPGSTVRGSPASVMAWGVGLLAAVTLARIPLLGSTQLSFVYLSAVMVGVPWLLAFVTYTWPPLDGASTAPMPASSATYTGVVIGLFSFVLHDLISFAVFVPGTAMTFFALLAWCLSYRGMETRPARKIAAHLPNIRSGRWPAAVAMIGLATVTVCGLLPVAKSGSFRRQAALAASAPPSTPITAEPAYAAYTMAAAADALDPTALVERAQWLVARAGDPSARGVALTEALNSLDAAALRDPQATRYHRLKMQIQRRLAEATGDASALPAAVTSAQAVLDRYPVNPLGLIDLADCEFAAGRALGSAEVLSDAIEHYQKALDLDDDRPDWEVLRCFGERKRAGLRARIQAAEEEVARLQPSP